MPRDVILYTRHGCHLCDDALAILQRHGLSPRLVDIDGDETLRQRYDRCVPVVVIDGQERFRGSVQEVLLRRLLKAMAIEPARTFGLFAKYWQGGQVKTRLAKHIGDESAARLQRIFVESLVARFATLPAELVLCYWPQERHAEFAAIVGNTSWQLQPQSDGDLGARLEHFFQSACARGCASAVVIGADSPTLPREYVFQAFQKLEDSPVALGPAEDGGYYLLGLRPPLPPIFKDMPWSTPLVFNETIARLKSAGIAYATLPPWYDVDDLEGLQRLRDELKQFAAIDGQIVQSPQAEIATAESAIRQNLSAAVDNDCGKTPRGHT